MQLKKTFLSSFAFLNFTQFFSALNDNVYKLLLVFLLISIKGPEESNTILSLVGVIFVIPFILLANLAGTLADHFSKRSIICWTRLFEIGIVALGVVSIAFHSAVGGYIVLFLMATQSALFSPAKYGIIPEIVKKEKLSRCNGIITASTYLAIILGTFLASFLAQITNKNFVLSSLFCLLIAILGAITAYRIEKTEPQAEQKKVSARLISGILATLKRARKIRYLFPVLIFGSYFLFLGAYTQLNIIPFTLQSLKLSEIQGGYLFLMTAIGIGLGSFLAGKAAGREIELGMVPIAAIGISVTLILIFLFSSHFYVVVPLLIILGVLGGFYVVPIDSFIQAASPPEDRGQNVAAGNLLSFLGVVLASFLIAFFGNGLGWSAAQGFLAVGILTFFIALILMALMADQVLRFLVARVAKWFWSLHTSGKKQLLFQAPVLLVAERVSWVDTIVVMATLPRLIRYIVPLKGKFLKSRQFLYRLLRLVPMDLDHFGTVGNKALRTIQEELKLGHPVCLMLPVRVESHNLKEWEEKVAHLLHELQISIVPIHIARTPLERETSLLKQLKILFKYPIKVSYGTPSRKSS